MEPLTLLYEPLPYPTLVVTAEPYAERPWIMRHWYAPIVIVHVVFFVIYLALLVYYLLNVLAVEKEMTKEGNDVYDDDNHEQIQKLHVEVRESRQESNYNPLESNAGVVSRQLKASHRRNARKTRSKENSVSIV